MPVLSTLNVILLHVTQLSVVMLNVGEPTFLQGPVPKKLFSPVIDATV
jgi:hypothetical protein